MTKEAQTAPCYKVHLPNGDIKYVTPTYLVMHDFKIPYGKGKYFKPRVFKPAPISKCQYLAGRMLVLADHLDSKGFYKEANELDKRIVRFAGMVDKAKEELKFLDDDEMNRWMKENLLELVKVFSKQGHSGGSAAYVIELLIPLLKQEPVFPLTGKDEEWVEVSDGLFQNTRCSHVFKTEKDGAYDIDGKIFEDPDGVTYTNKDSRVPVIFPYIPESTYVKVDHDGNPLTVKAYYVPSKETKVPQPLRRNYDDYGESIYMQMNNFKSIKDFLDKRRKKRNEKVSSLLFNRS